MSYLITPDGVRLRYSDRGNGKHTILLVHGWKSSHRVWDRTVAHLENNFRVISFDLRGMGESDKPNGKYNFEELSSDIGFIINELELKDITLVGWSMGCSVSLEYMKRSGFGVSKLVLVNGPIRLTKSPEFPWSMSIEQLEGYIDDLSNNWPLKERAFVEESIYKQNPGLVEWLFHLALQTPLDNVLKVVKEQAKLDHRKVLSQIDIPVLAIYGKHDPYYPVELAEYIASQCPNGQQVIMSQSAHLPFMEESEEFEKVLTNFVESKVRHNTF